MKTNGLFYNKLEGGEVYLFSFVKLLQDNYFISAPKKDCSLNFPLRPICNKDIYGQCKSSLTDAADK